MLVAGAFDGLLRAYYYNHVCEQWVQVGQKNGDGGGGGQQIGDGGAGEGGICISREVEI